MTASRVIAVDDHVMVRRCVRTILARHREWSICGEVANGMAGVEMTKKIRPDVVIMDLSMPELNGLEATRQIRQLPPGTAVLVFTWNESETVIQAAISAGASGCLFKRDSSTVFTQAAEALTQHQASFTPKATEVLLHARLWPVSKNGASENPTHLTAREGQIVQLVAESHTTKEIARILGISVKTAENHRNSLMHKLKVNSMTGVVRHAVRNEITIA